MSCLRTSKASTANTNHHRTRHKPIKLKGHFIRIGLFSYRAIDELAGDSISNVLLNSSATGMSSQRDEAEAYA